MTARRLLPPAPLNVSPSLGRSLRGSAARRWAGAAIVAGLLVLHFARPIIAGAVLLALLLVSTVPDILRILGVLVLTPVAVTGWKSWLTRRSAAHESRTRIDPDADATLNRFVTDLCNELEVRPVPFVTLTPDGDVRLLAETSWRSVISGVRWEITISRGFLQTSDLTEVKALCAARLAPLARGSTERRITAVVAVADGIRFDVDVVDELIAERSSMLLSIVWITDAVVSWPIRLAIRLARGWVPSTLLDDDRRGVAAAGSNALVFGLMHAWIARERLAAVRERLTPAIDDSYVPDKVYPFLDAQCSLIEDEPALPARPRNPMGGRYDDWLEELIPVAHYRTRGPTPDVREENAKAEWVPTEFSDQPAVELLDRPDYWDRRLSAVLVREYWPESEGCRPLPFTVVRDSMVRRPPLQNDPHYEGIYDGERPIDIGSSAERERLIGSINVRTVGLTAAEDARTRTAAERIRRWTDDQRQLTKAFAQWDRRPSAAVRSRIRHIRQLIAREERRLAEYDQWMIAAHMVMAGRLPEIAPHERLVDALEYLTQLRSLIRVAREHGDSCHEWSVDLEEGRIVPRSRQAFETSRDSLASLRRFADRINVRGADLPPEVRLADLLFCRRPPPRIRDRRPDEEDFHALRDCFREVGRKAFVPYRSALCAYLKAQDDVRRRYHDFFGNDDLLIVGESVGVERKGGGGETEEDSVLKTHEQIPPLSTDPPERAT